MSRGAMFSKNWLLLKLNFKRAFITTPPKRTIKTPKSFKCCFWRAKSRPAAQDRNLVKFRKLIVFSPFTNSNKLDRFAGSFSKIIHSSYNSKGLF